MSKDIIILGSTGSIGSSTLSIIRNTNFKIKLLTTNTNVKKILNIDDVINKPYSKVTIQLTNDYNLKEIKELLSNKGETKIDLIVKDKNKLAYYSLQENRKFDLNHLKALKAKKYVEKITV